MSSRGKRLRREQLRRIDDVGGPESRTRGKHAGWAPGRYCAWDTLVACADSVEVLDAKEARESVGDEVATLIDDDERAIIVRAGNWVECIPIDGDFDVSTAHPDLLDRVGSVIIEYALEVDAGLPVPSSYRTLDERRQERKATRGKREPVRQMRRAVALKRIENS